MAASSSSDSFTRAAMVKQGIPVGGLATPCLEEFLRFVFFVMHLGD
jgi:hypothetical protein